ncbi:MAG: hypothetical protein JSS66_03365 [Armatimonadetes bacterium]|nr:hypothetical protein [Armatimonadota bacterium]
MKRFALRLENIGSVKQEASKPLGEFHFHTSSPIHFIAADVEEYVVYRCTVDEFDQRTVAAIANLREKVIAFGQSVKETLDKEGEPNTAEQDQLMKRFDKIVEESSVAMMETVQLDEGEYELTIEITYRGKKGKGWGRARIAKSSVRFRFGKEFRDQVKSSIKSCVEALGRMIVRGEAEPIPYPEYHPEFVKSGSMAVVKK